MSKNLYKQLRESGANTHEADQLARLAGAMGNIKTKGLSEDTRRRILDDTIGAKPRIVYPMRWATGALAAVFVAVATFALFSPSSQSATEIYREDDQTPAVEQITPEESAVIEQMQVVEQLKEENAPEDAIKEAEDRYEKSVINLWERNAEEDKENDYWEWWNRRYESRSRDVNGWWDDRDDKRSGSRWR